MKVLTANIAYGFKGMDRLMSSVWHQLHIHGPGILMYEFLPGLRGLSPTVSEAKRVAYAQKHRHLEPLVGAEIRAGMRQQMLERFTNVDPFPLLYELSLRVQNAPRDAAKVAQHPVGALAEIIETLVAPLRERQAA